MRKLFIILLTSSLLSLFLCNNAIAREDWEFWNMETIKAKITDKIGLTLIEEFRFNEDSSTFYTHVQYLGPTYTFNENFGVGILHQMVNSKKNDDWNTNHRFDLDAYISTKIYDFKIDTRTRFERDVTINTWTYRAKEQISYDIILFNRNYTPYISNEGYLALTPEVKYNENRMEIGIKTGFLFGTEIGSYYMNRMKKPKNDWINSNVLGLNLSYKF